MSVSEPEDEKAKNLAKKLHPANVPRELMTEGYLAGMNVHFGLTTNFQLVVPKIL